MGGRRERRKKLAGSSLGEASRFENATFAVLHTLVSKFVLRWGVKKSIITVWVETKKHES